MLPEEDSGSTGEKQIADLHFSICINKSAICFSSVAPEASSGVTSLWATMSSVPAERAVIDHVADEKPKLKLIDWGTNFVVYPGLTIFKNRKWNFQCSFGMIKNIILENIREYFEFAIEVQTQILQLLYFQCHIFNGHDFTDLINEWRGSINYLEEPNSLTDALCKYYDNENTFKSCLYRYKTCENNLISNDKIKYFCNILVVGKDNLYKSKFVSIYTNTKFEKLSERSPYFIENTKEIKTENSNVILNVIEGPKLNEYSSLIADKLESVDACIFVYDRYTEDSFEAIEGFVWANWQLLTNIEWFLWGNIAKDESLMKEENVIKFCLKYNCEFYEFPFDKKKR